MTQQHGDIPLISSPTELATLCNKLKKHEWIAIDTEFLREKTYKPKLCLIQVATNTELACIDPLALDSIDPFLELLFDRNIIKVFHAAGQDLEIFYWMRGEVPGPIFDTQIAAPLLGHNEQIGYGNLVREALGVDLAKSHSRADWMRRPLPEVQLRYAADDVIYLAQLYPKMRESLESHGRLEWLNDDFNALENTGNYEKEASQVWQRVRGIQKHKGKTLAAIQKIAAWREVTARDTNLPRNWLLKDEIIVDIARQYPDSTKELGHIRGLADATIRRHGETLLALLKESEHEKPQPLPPFSKKTKLSPAQDAIIDLLSTLTKLRGDELGINPAMLAPRKELERLLVDPENSILSSGWRKKLIGEQLNDLLDGNVSMQISGQKIQLTHTHD